MTSRGNSSISPPVQIPLQSQPRQVNLSGLPSGTPPPQQQFYPGQTQVYEYIPGPGSAPPQTGPLLSYQAYGSAPNDLRSGAAGVGRGGGPPQALAQGGTIFQQPGQTMRPQPPQQPGQATYFISQGVMRQPRPPQQPQTMLYMPPGNFTTPTGNVVLQQVGQYPTRNMGPYYSPNQGYYGNFPQQMYIHSNQMGAGRGMINPQNPNRPGSQPREKKLIEIKDPNSGRNVTDEILHSQRPHSVESEHTEEPSASRQANDIPSQFALKVAERLKTPGSPEVPVETSPATNGDISGAGPVSGGQYQQPPPMGGMMRPPMMPGQGPMHPSHMMGAHQGMMHPGASATPPEMHQRPPVDLSLPPPQLPPQVRQPTPAQIYSVGPQQGQHSQGPHHGQRHPQPQQVVRSAPMPPPAMVPQQQVQQQQELAQPQQPQQQPVAMPPQSQPVAEEPPAAPVEEKRPAAPKPAPVQQPPALENIPQPAAVVPVSVPTPAAAPAPVKEESPAPAEEVAPASPKEPTPARETTPPKTEEPAGANIQANKDGRKGKKAKKDFSRKDIGGSDMDAFIDEKSVESVDTKPPLPPSATERRTSLDNKGTPVEKPAFSYADAATSAVDSNKAKQPSPPQAATPAPVNQPKQADEEKLPEAEVSPAEPSPPTEAPKEAAAPVPAPQPTVQKVSPEPEAPAKASSATIPAEVPSARPSEEDEVPPVERKVDSEAAPVDPVPQVKVNDENAPPKEVKATTENAKDESPVGEEDGFKKPAEKPKPKGEDAKERLLYDRTYLISLRECPHSQTKPEGLPNLDIILDKPNISSSRSAMSTSLDFTPSFFQPAAGNQRAPQIGKSSSRGRQRPDMPQQRIIKSVSIQNDVKMLHQSEKPWKPKAAVAGDAEKAPSKSLESDVLFIMNRLTPTNFEKLAGEMRQLAIKTYEDLQQLVKIFFDKVTIETKFVQAYAQLCRVLSQIKVPPPPGMKENQATFRVVMLTKCQQEFEADKSIVFEDPEEKKKKLEAEIPDAPDKAEKIDTILYKMKLKRLKFYGNIRFIGELFKLNMLTENIMHDCIFRLLKARDDDSLVSLCNLISTVGQNLDTEKAKSRMDQYFTQMEKIAEERKSRIKFTLKDVIDLRKHNWVPRKETTGPKKIDEIHKDFQKEQIRQQFLSSQPPPPRNDNQQPGSRRGSRQREEQKPSDDGWNTVGSKSLRIDASKMKLSKNVVDEDNIQLGPGGGMNRFSMWGRGSSGNAQPSQDTERAPASNRFSALRNEEDRRNFQRSPSRGDSGPAGRGMRQGPTAGHGRGRNLARSSQEGERRDLLNSARSIVGGGGRSQNSSRDNSWNREDRRPAMGPRGSREGESQMTRSDIVRPSDDYRSPNVPPAAPAKKIREMSEEEMEAKARTILEEYLNIRDLTEAKLCVSELAGQPRLHLVVTASINDVLERNDKARELTGQYLHELVKNNVISLDAYFKGLSEVLQFAEDMVIDIPMMWSYLAQTIAPLLVGGSLPWAKLSTILKADLSENCAVLLLVQLVKVSTSLTSEAEVAQMWQNSGLSWADFVKPSDVEGFLKDKSLEYTINPVSASSLPPRPSVSANSEADLERLKRDIESMTFKGCPDHELKSHIEKLVPADRRDKTFVRTLTTAIVKSSIALPEPKVNEDVIRNRREVLGTFINKPEFELEALYAIQALMTELEHPKAVINTLFDSFYNEEIVSEEAFKLWETSNDPAEQLGKGVCKLQLKQFFTWLRENEEVEASS